MVRHRVAREELVSPRNAHGARVQRRQAVLRLPREAPVPHPVRERRTEGKAHPSEAPVARKMFPWRCWSDSAIARSRIDSTLTWLPIHRPHLWSRIERCAAIRASTSVAELRAQRDDLTRQLGALEEETDLAPNPVLLDSLPVGKVNPAGLSRRLFEALRLEIHYDPTTRIATVRPSTPSLRARPRL